MRNFRLRTWCGAVLIVLVLSLVAAPAGLAGDGTQGIPPEEASKDCRECHWDIYLVWEASSHGQGLSCGQCHLADQQNNHARLGHGAQGGPEQCMSCHTTGYDPVTDTWEEDNVHCSACHNPYPENHPDEPMPTDRSEELCGQCHIQARFEWQTSKHGQAGVACVSCHNQHETSLISSEDDVLEQCALCHETRTAEFGASMHSDKGVSCQECHLAPLGQPLGAGTAKLNHSFVVELDTCMSCHESQLHQAVAPSPSLPKEAAYEQVDSLASNVDAAVCPNPNTPNPTSLVTLVGVFGIGVGAVSVPRVSRWLSHLRKKVR